MSSILTTNGIDTVLVTGVTSSGCVRATIVDSFSYGFRTIAIDDACGDQDAGPHDANMQDVGRRYADVIQTDEAIANMDKEFKSLKSLIHAALVVNVLSQSQPTMLRKKCL